MENKIEFENEGIDITTNYLNHEEICELISYVQKLVGRLTQQHELTYEEMMFLNSAYDDLGRVFASHFRNVAKNISKEDLKNEKQR